MVEPDSLGAAVDAVNEAHFLGHQLPMDVRRGLARWIASRQGLPGSYSGLPAPTEVDFAAGARLFTGESVTSRAGSAHVLGEEACRALILLDVAEREVQSALQRAINGMLERLSDDRRRKDTAPGRAWNGIYCCAGCTVALWRHLAVGGLQAVGPSEWLEAGLANLAAHRTSNGRWRRYPFYYTLLALSELDLPAALDERRHAAQACERLMRMAPRDGSKYAARRRTLAERVLSSV